MAFIQMFLPLKSGDNIVGETSSKKMLAGDMKVQKQS